MSLTSESVKRQYRSLSEAVRRSDSSKSNILLRQRIRDHSESLIFADPIDSGRKGEESMWRKAYYELYSDFKSKRNPDLKVSHTTLERHLMSGIGAYHHILARLEYEYGIKIAGITDVSVRLTGNFSLTDGRRTDQSTEDSRPSHKNWGILCAHRCLIAQGDLCRYLYELNGLQSGCSHRHAALRYYQQAILLKPELGHPYNQLGTMEGNSLFGLRSVYYYLRGTICNQPFGGTESNLKTCLEKNRVALKKIRSEAPSPKFVEELLARCVLDYVAKLHGFANEDIKLETVMESVEKSNVNDECLFFMTLIFLSTWKKFSDDAGKQDSIKNLLIMIGSRITKTVYRRLCEKTCLHHPFNVEEEKRTNGADKIVGETEELDENRNVSPKRIPKSKIKRRRRVFGDESDDDDGVEVGSQESKKRSRVVRRDSLSDGASSDENGSWISSDEFELSDSSESSEDEEESTGKENGTILDDKIESIECNLSDDYELDTALSWKQLVKEISAEKTLSALKLLLLWATQEKKFIQLDGEPDDFRFDFLKRCADLANLLYVLTQKIFIANDSEISYVRLHLQKYAEGIELPLPEDVQFPLLGNRSAEWEERTVMSTDVHCSVYRIGVISQKISKLCKESLENEVIIHESERVIISDSLLLKYQKGTPIVENGEKLEIEKDSNEQKERKQGLMKTMAQAWLEHEVRGLEKQLNNDTKQKCKSQNGAVTVSLKELRGAFLVVDASALAHRLPVIKQIAASKSKLIVVPTCVVSELDAMKKDLPTARDAIRWLETELRNGSPYIRAQKSFENGTISLLKYPKRKERESWQLFQILECCNYFNEKENFSYTDTLSNGDSDETTLVSFLYVKNKNELPENVGSLTKAIGIKLVDIDEISHSKNERSKTVKRPKSTQSFHQLPKNAG